MKAAALLVALVIAGIGVVGVIAPDRLVAAARSVITPLGLYAIGALRIAMGIVLILAAPISRAPRSLRLLGGLIVIAGVATPFVGVDRARAIRGLGNEPGSRAAAWCRGGDGARRRAHRVRVRRRAPPCVDESPMRGTRS